MISVNNQGNIVSPNGATFLYGSKITESNDSVSIVEQDQILLPYEILIVDEDDEGIPAESIIYEPIPGSEISGSTVASAINELEDLKVSKSGDTMTGALILSGREPTDENEAVSKKYVDNATPSFSQERFVASGGETSFTLNSQLPGDSMMVFYNGLLVNLGIHYNYANNVITLDGFSAEANDIITVIGLAAPADAILNAIGGSY